MNEYMNSSGDLELKNKKISEIAFTEISPHLPLNIAIVLKSSVEASRTHTHTKLVSMDLRANFPKCIQ